MRRWLALLAGFALVAIAGTALGLAGSLDVGEEDAVTETTLEAKEEPVEEKPVKEEPVEEEPVEEEPVEEAPAKDEPIPEATLEEEETPDKEVDHPEPVDDTPPLIEVLYPEDGQVFEHREVVFEGITEPGAHVFAGKWEADVNEEGEWRIVLYLEKGENHVTFKAWDEHENYATDSVTVIYEAPKEEEPKEEEPKEEEPKEEEPHEWEFSAHQLYGECGEDPPYDVFHGTGKPGTVIHVESEFGGGETEIGKKGGWEIKVYFEEAPVGEAFAVWVSDQFGNHKVFEFIHTG